MIVLQLRDTEMPVIFDLDPARFRSSKYLARRMSAFDQSRYSMRTIHDSLIFRNQDRLFEEAVKITKLFSTSHARTVRVEEQNSVATDSKPNHTVATEYSTSVNP